MKHKTRTRILPVLLATIAANLGSFVLGFSLGFPSPIQDKVKKLGILDEITFPIFSSCIFFLAIAGSLIVLFAADYIGRKTLIILFTVPNTLGWLLISFAYNGAVMLVGRGLTGISWGAISALTSVYVAELAPKRFKGLYGSFFNHAFLSGIFISHFLGLFLTFQWLALVPIFVHFLQILLMFWQPYSPTWLVSRGLEKQALKTLIYLRGNEKDSEAELFQIKETVENFSLSLFQRFRALFSEFHYLKALLVTGICFTCVSLTGIAIITAYSASILKSSRLIPPKVASLVPTLVQVFAALLCTILVDRVGRKPLLIVSSIGIAFCHALLSSYYFGSSFIWSDCQTLNQNTTFTTTNGVAISVEFCDYITLLPIIALLILRFSYGIGWGPIPWILVGEAFPTKIRSVAASFSIVLKLLSAGLPTLVFPYLVSSIGAHFVFLIFVLFNISSAIFVHLFVPETKGKSPKEIEELYKGTTIYVTCACKHLNL